MPKHISAGEKPVINVVVAAAVRLLMVFPAALFSTATACAAALPSQSSLFTQLSWIPENAELSLKSKNRHIHSDGIYKNEKLLIVKHAVLRVLNDS